MRFRFAFGLPSFLASFANFWTPESPGQDHPSKVDRGAWDHAWDGKEDEQRSVATRHILLIRHGDYEKTAADDDSRRLTDRGRQQILAIAQRLNELRRIGLVASPITRIISSTQIRAIESADVLYQRLDTDGKALRISDELLCEGNPCPPEPTPVWWSSTDEEKCDREGQRIDASFHRYFHRATVDQSEDSYEIIVSHGNVIRYLILRALQFPPSAWNRLSLGQAGITWIAIRPNGFVHMHCFNDLGHVHGDLMCLRDPRDDSLFW